MSEHIVYHAVVNQVITNCIGHDEPPMDEDTIGIYSSQELADAGVARYRAERLAECGGEDPEKDWGDVVQIRPVELNKDLIYPHLGPQGSANE